MWPWGHLGVGYLLGRWIDTRIAQSLHTPLATVSLLVGTQAPDLIDKPLAWSVHLLPNGRSLAHSLLVGPLLVALAVLVLRGDRRQPIAIAFGIGYLAHLGGDALYPALRGEFASLGFLLWPVVPPLEYDTAQTFIAHFAQLAATPTVLFETGVFVLALVVAARRVTRV